MYFCIPLARTPTTSEICPFHDIPALGDETGSLVDEMKSCFYVHYHGGSKWRGLAFRLDGANQLYYPESTHLLSLKRRLDGSHSRFWSFGLLFPFHVDILALAIYCYMLLSYSCICFCAQASPTNFSVWVPFACVIGRDKLFFIFYRVADKSLARPTSRCILFDCENI